MCIRDRLSGLISGTVSISASKPSVLFSQAAQTINLTSQFWANCTLNSFDHFVKRELRCTGYVRYVDDFLLFADDKAENIVAAARRGWRTHQFESWQGWAERLVAEGLLTMKEAGL